MAVASLLVTALLVTPAGAIKTFSEFGTPTPNSEPTGITLGPDGNLYVSNYGFGYPPNGSGQILKITLHDCPED
jgi:DNA-binding beta-propeller fold protein YncE